MNELIRVVGRILFAKTHSLNLKSKNIDYSGSLSYTAGSSRTCHLAVTEALDDCPKLFNREYCCNRSPR